MFVFIFPSRWPFCQSVSCVREIAFCFDFKKSVVSPFLHLPKLSQVYIPYQLYLRCRLLLRLDFMECIQCISFRNGSYAITISVN